MGNVIDFQAVRAARQMVKVEPAPAVSIIDQLIAQYPNLEQGGSCVVAAKNIRKELKAAFPGVKFSVRTSQYAGGNSINVSYDDGPMVCDVESIVNRYEYGKFDGMQDLYEYNGSKFTEVFGGTRYAFVERGYSRAAVELAISRVVADWGAKDAPSYDEYKNGSAWNKYPGSEQSYYYNWQQLIGQELSKLDLFKNSVDVYQQGGVV